jgi:hypothetical protein
VCQWAGHALFWARAAHLPAFNAVVGLASHGRPSATGTWQGWPSWSLLGDTVPLPRGREVRDPEASPGGQAHRGLAPTRGGAGHPGGSGPVEAIPEHPVLMGTWRHRTYKSTGGRSGDHDPNCQARAVRLVTQRPRARSRITLRPSGWTLCQITLWRWSGGVRPPCCAWRTRQSWTP